MTNRLALVAIAVVSLISPLAAQAAKPGLTVPKGTQVALIVFEDLECPECRRTAPLLKEAVKTYKIPLVVHDFPLPMHPWSFDAAVFAHFFDARSKQLGYDFRDYIYEHQMEITPSNLRTFAERFAADHKVDMPFVIDPQGKLAGEVNADRDFGKQVGIDHTPTIYVVSNKPGGGHTVEVKKPHDELFQTIDAMK
jgi:protein-disulfide isomerase